MARKTAQKPNANSSSNKTGTKPDLRLASFFAGIGGFDLGFQRVGFKPVFHCEINEYCNSVLDKHWPKAGRFKDISQIKPHEIPDADTWCGGFPCQDVSVARGWLGRDGLRGQNTGLFYPFVKLVEARLPSVVIMENVTGLLNSHGGRDFAVVLHTFFALGYAVAWRVLNTRYFGAPQSRPRVYICAWRGSADSAFRVLYEAGHSHVPESPRLGFLRPSICSKTGAVVPEVAFCLAATSGRHTGTDWSRSYVAYHDEVRRLTPTECERIQGFPEGWTLPHNDFHQTSDDIDSLRYHAIGNAVSVPVVSWVAKRVALEMKGTKPALPTGDLFSTQLGRFASHVPDLMSSKSSHLRLPGISSRDDAPPIKWMTGGVMEGGECLMAPVSPSPSKPIGSKFVEALDPVVPERRYFLSPNAAKGILRRVNGQGRQLFGPLTDALERLQQK